jgi:hypothetical protein
VWLRSQANPATAAQLLKESRAMWTRKSTDKLTAVVCESLAQSGQLPRARPLLAHAIVRCTSAQRHKLLLTASAIELAILDS